jgi:hypothetical protein
MEESQSVPTRLSVTAGASSGIDSSASVLLNCTTYSDNSYATESITGTFTITSSGGGGPTGGGGGGGGIEYIVVNLTDFTLTISPEIISLLYEPGQNYSRYLDIKNSNTDYIDVTVSVLCSSVTNTTNDPSCDWVWLVDDSGQKTDQLVIKVAPGTEKLPTRSTVEISVDVPKNASYQEYKALLQFEAQGAQAVVPVTLKTWIAVGGIWTWSGAIFFDILNIKLLGPFVNPIPLIGEYLLLIHVVIGALILIGIIYIGKQIKLRQKRH